MISYQRSMGQYETPQTTVDYMVYTVLNHLRPATEERPQILDPSTGDGIFIRSLIQSGIKPSNLHAYDIDPNVAPPHNEVHFYHKDFLKLEDTEKFDAIIGNPPYKSKRQSRYLQENKIELTEKFNPIGVHNMYSLFIFKSIQVLKEGGILTMIVQDSFLTNVYYKHFRKYLLQHTEIKEIILAPRRLFRKGKADVRTAILTLEKKHPHRVDDLQEMKLVDRLINQEYFCPPAEQIQHLSQTYFERIPNHNFAINVPPQILDLFKEPYDSIGDVLEGGTGISTGNDRHFLRKSKEVKNNSEWVPFYKNGGIKDAWYYEPKYFIQRDWSQNAEKHTTFTVRNQAFFYREGITCSSMGVEFSAAYLPRGSLFGVNANLFADNEEDLFYFLGFLNSKLVKFLLRKVLNRTNMITSGYIKRLPYIEPSPHNKKKVIQAARLLVQGKMIDPHLNTQPLQRIVDESIYEVYQISEETKKNIERFCSQLLETI